MKKLISVFTITIVGLVSLTQFSKAQETSENKLDRSFYVELGKTRYALMEPIFAKFKLTLISGERVPNISRVSSIRINFGSKISEFRGLSSFVTQGEPQPLPSRNSVRGNTNVERKYYVYERDEIIDRTSEFFQEPGNYQIQFLLNYPDANATILSNVINIIVEEPTGINKEAFDFLKKYENAGSFYWVWQEKNGISLLEKFAKDYGESVYGESAISYLGNLYLAKNELDRAQVEFEKLKTSENSIIATEAKKSLAEIMRRKADSEKLRQQNRP